MPPKSTTFAFNIDWDNLPTSQTTLYQSALSVARSQWQKSIIVEMLSDEGCIRPITKLSRGNNIVNRQALDGLIQRLNILPGIEVFIQEAQYPSLRSYRINKPYAAQPVYRKPSRFWDAPSKEPTLEPYDINILLLKIASEKNPIYAVPIAERLVGITLSEEELEQQQGEIKLGNQSIIFEFDEKKRKIYEEQEKRRRANLKPEEHMYGGVLVAYRLDFPTGKENEYAKRRHAFNYLIKRAQARGIQFIRTPVAATVEYTIDYQHGGAVFCLPPMESNECLNLEAFSRQAMKKRKRKFRIAKKKTDGSVRKFAKVKRQPPVKRKHYKPKMMDINDLMTKIDTDIAPPKIKGKQ